MNTQQTHHRGQPVAVHGVPINSRYNNPREIQEMSAFCELLAQNGLIGHIDSVFYNSKADLCCFEFKGALDESSLAARAIRLAALETIYQFEWCGYMEQGKPCDEETERLVAETEQLRMGCNHDD